MYELVVYRVSSTIFEEKSKQHKHCLKVSLMNFNMHSFSAIDIFGCILYKNKQKKQTNIYIYIHRATFGKFPVTGL